MNFKKTGLFIITLFIYYNIKSQIVTEKKYIDTSAILNRVTMLYTPGYLEIKKQLEEKYRNMDPGRFGEFNNGSLQELDTDEKLIAFTFDACVGAMNTYNAGLINLLRKEGVPATLFVGGSWITCNADIFQELAKDTLFEIENHGLLHRVCSVNGRSVYGVWSTRNIGDVVDEIELNARRIERLTGRRPLFFRSSTAFCDEVSVKIAHDLGMNVVSYSVLSEDAIPFKSAGGIIKNILSNVVPGSIVIMHFNHPLWNEEEAMKIIIPLLRKEGYRFVKLKDCQLKKK